MSPQSVMSLPALKEAACRRALGSPERPFVQGDCLFDFPYFLCLPNPELARVQNGTLFLKVKLDFIQFTFQNKVSHFAHTLPVWLGQGPRTGHFF